MRLRPEKFLCCQDDNQIECHLIKIKSGTKPSSTYYKTNASIYILKDKNSVIRKK
jgi:hypothetical protein